MKTVIIILGTLLFISIGGNIWQYYNPRVEKQKGETVYISNNDKPEVAVTNLPNGNQSATVENQQDYDKKISSAKELLTTVKSIPDLEESKRISEITSAKAVLELQLTEKDLVINDKDKQIKEWKDKYNSVKIDNANNKADVISEVSPKIIGSEKREHWYSAKIPYTTITSENPSIKFYGLESYTFKNPKQKNLLELNVNIQGTYFDEKIYPQGNAELIFNPDGRLRPYGGYGYYYDYNEGKFKRIIVVGGKINLLKL